MSLLRDPQVARNVSRSDLEFDEFGIDSFGISREHLIGFYSPFAAMYRDYLKVTEYGRHHIPRRGRTLIISNHSGGIGADAAMIMTSMLLDDDNPRVAHGMAEYFFNRWPFVSQLFSRVGHLTGLPEHAERMLETERMVIAFPEGARGTAKLYRDAYKLVRFGTGFMRLALKMKAPIVPTAFIGGEEAFPTMFHIKGLHRLLGAPYVPVAPQLLMWPLPVACQIHYGEPLFFEGDGMEPDEIIADYVGQVRDAIAGLIQQGLDARPKNFIWERLPEDAVTEDA